MAFLPLPRATRVSPAASSDADRRMPRRGRSGVPVPPEPVGLVAPNGWVEAEAAPWTRTVVRPGEPLLGAPVELLYWVARR